MFFGIVLNHSEHADNPEVLFSLWKIPFTDTAFSAFLITFLILGFFLFTTYKMNLKKMRCYLAELVYDIAYSLGSLALQDRVKDHVIFIAALFFYILIANILPLFPIPVIYYSEHWRITSFFKSPTSDLSSTFALSICAIFYVNYVSIKSNGFKRYLRHLIEPLPFLLPLNIIGELVRPFSLAMRLFGNIFSGILIMEMIYRGLPLIVPAFGHLYFDLFVGLIQSIVFISLTAVYISFAI